LLDDFPRVLQHGLWDIPIAEFNEGSLSNQFPASCQRHQSVLSNFITLPYSLNQLTRRGAKVGMMTRHSLVTLGKDIQQVPALYFLHCFLAMLLPLHRPGAAAPL